ncbi:MAG TPA: T9SS type A sorting domain-containing protein [Flavobacteriaceae bacterium]
MKIVSISILLIWLGAITHAQTWLQDQKIVASDRNDTDFLGIDVAIDGNRLIVGSHMQDFDENGQNEIAGAGAVYIFEEDVSNNWIEVDKLVASDRADNDQFGWSVAVSGDYAIVGAYLEDNDVSGGNFLSASGSAYIFERDTNGNWQQVQKLTAAVRGLNDRFGWDVSISGDYAIVGSYFEDEDENDQNFLSGAGSAYIFKRDGTGIWNQVQKIVAQDRSSGDLFGHSVFINQDRLIVGAPGQEDRPGAAYVFEKDGTGNWAEVKKLTALDGTNGDQFGYRVGIDTDYTIVVALTEEEDASGQNTITDSGSAYIFERDGTGEWSQAQKLVASDRDVNSNWFGYGVSIGGKYAVIGARYEDKDGSGQDPLTDAGAAYIYERNMDGTWSEMQKIVNTDRSIYNQFGYSVAISGDFLIAGAVGETLDASGQNPISRAGAAYVFQLTPPLNIDNDSFGPLLKIYPNPTNWALTLDLGTNYGSIILTLTNCIGQTLLTKSFRDTDNINFEIEGAKGVYFAQVATGDGKYVVLKVVKR